VKKPTKRSDSNPRGTVVIAEHGAEPQKVTDGKSLGGEVLKLLDGTFIKVKTSGGDTLCKRV
jgi:hypothetical protein